jgi:hypothetical protein
MQIVPVSIIAGAQNNEISTGGSDSDSYFHAFDSSTFFLAAGSDKFESTAFSCAVD